MADIFGEITPPQAIQNLITATTQDDQDNGGAIFVLLSRIFTLIGIAAGIFFVIQVILAGYAYISANGDPKKTEAAWAKIYQSIIGLVIVSSAFVIAAVIGNIVGINILNPEIKP